MINYVSEENLEKLADTLLEKFTNQRQLELLSYASTCFNHCTSPFELTHLQKMEVKADEAVWLSTKISAILNDKIDKLACLTALEGKRTNNKLGKELRLEAESKFQETQ